MRRKEDYSMKFLVRLSVILVASLTCAWSMDLLNSWRSFFDFVALVQVISIIAIGLSLSFRPMIIAAAVFASFGGMRSLPSANRLRLRHVWVRAHSLAWAAGAIGLVLQIISLIRNMDDPAAIGPSIATGLLPLLYGAVLAEMCFSPLADAVAAGTDTDIAPRVGSVHAMGAALAVLVLVLLVVASRSEMRPDDVWRASGIEGGGTIESETHLETSHVVR